MEGQTELDHKKGAFLVSFGYHGNISGVYAPKTAHVSCPKRGGGAFFAQITVGRGQYVIANTPK